MDTSGCAHTHLSSSGNQNSEEGVLSMGLLRWLLLLLLLLSCLSAGQAGGVGVSVDGSGDLLVTPPAGRAVLVQGVDVPGMLAALDGRLGALETALLISAQPMPAPPAAASGQAPWIGQDPLGNLLIIPAPNRTLVMAGVRVLELLAHAGRRLAVLEHRVFGPGAAPNVTSTPAAPPPSPLSRPGTVGLGADGNIRIEPLPGKAVLAAGRDMMLELHRIAARLNLTEMAMATCLCLAPPATCSPCNAEGCQVPWPASGLVRSIFCRCRSGWQGPGCRENQDECALGVHNCNASRATCVDTVGSFACACKAGFAGGACTRGASALQWVRQTGSVSGDEGGLVAVDAAGRVFLAGSVSGSADGFAFLGGEPAGGFDVFLAAYNGSTGAKLWSQALGTSGDDRGYDVTSDSASSIYVTGFTAGSSLDGQANAGAGDVFLARFDGGNGTRRWTRLLGTSSNDFGHIVAVEPGKPDVVYIGGSTWNTTGGGLPGSSGGLGGGRDAFAARYSSNGTREWVRQFGSSWDDVCLAAAVHQSEIFATGWTTGTMAGPANAGRTDVFVTRITALGSVAWTAQLGSTSDDWGLGIAVDTSGVYVAGYTGGSLSGQPFAGGSWDAFVAKYSHAGVWTWTRLLGTDTDDAAYSIVLDRSSSCGCSNSSNSSVLVVGTTDGNLSSDQASMGANDVFVASFTGSGELQWVRLYGTTADEAGRAMAVDASSSALYVAGETGGPMYGQRGLGQKDLFLLKLQHVCEAGLTGDGAVCTNMNECVTGAHNCDASSARCADTAGSFTCACNAGYTGSGVVCNLATVSGSLQWARQTGTANDDLENRVAVDDAGRVIMVGYVVGSIDNLTFAGGSFDVYLLAYNGSTGARLWSQMLGTSADDRSFGVASDGAGSVYVAGFTTGSSLGGLPTAGNSDAFLARFDGGSGALVWVRTLGTPGDDQGYGVAADPANPDAVYLCGFTSDTGPSGLPDSAGGLGGFRDAFVARYARNGTRVWVRQFGTGGSDHCNSVAVFQSEVYATGWTTGDMAATGNAGSGDIYVTQMTALRTVVWTAQLGQPGADRGEQIAVDHSGVYVTGYVPGGLNGEPYAGGAYDAFVACFTHAGAWVWTRMLGTATTDKSYSLALDRGINVLVAGYTSGALDGQTSIGLSDMFVASFSSAGELQWVRLYGSASDDTGWSIAVDSRSGAAFLAGVTGASVDGQPSRGKQDFAVLKLL